MITKKDVEDFKNSTKCWICNNICTKSNVKVRDHCHITRKYRGSAHKDCNINVKLLQKIRIVFHLKIMILIKLKIIMQELGKFDFKINIIRNGLEK